MYMYSKDVKLYVFSKANPATPEIKLYPHKHLDALRTETVGYICIRADLILV